MSKRLTTWLLVILLASIVLTACSSTPKQTVQYEGDPQMQATITVMYSGGLNFFNKDYGDLFRAKYPNIEVKVIGAWRDVEKVREEQKPDVLLLSYEDYVKLTGEGKLYDLNNMITEDAFNLEGVNQDIIDFLRQSGGGKLYGLPPHFDNQALFYNKDLFDKYSIPYPQDGMTWNEVFQLAKRFPIEDGVSGFTTDHLSSLRYKMETSQGLRSVNRKEMRVTVNTESYKKLFETLVDAHRSSTLEIKDYGEEVYDSFITGKSAMTVDYYYYLNNNIYWAKTERGDDFHLNWDVATAPVGESNSEATPYFIFGNIYAVNADTLEAQAAWELVKFINSEEVARMKSRTTTNSIPTRTDYIYNPEGKRMEIFYKNLNMDWALRENNPKTNIPDNYYVILGAIMDSEFMAASRGDKSIDEALQSIQERGQEELDKQLVEKSKKEDQ